MVSFPPQALMTIASLLVVEGQDHPSFKVRGGACPPKVTYGYCS